MATNRLPRLDEPRGVNALIHAVLGLAALLAIANFVTALDRMDTRKEMIAEALFRTPPAAMALVAGAPAGKAPTVTNAVAPLPPSRLGAPIGPAKPAPAPQA